MSPQAPVETIIEPDLPIIDPHHHLWFLPEASVRAIGSQDNALSRAMTSVLRHHAHYMFDELMADLQSGHNVRATVAVEAHVMYRAAGPEVMRSVGEVEFLNGVAAIAASGLFGETRACAGIVGGVDLALGDAVKDVLFAHIQAGGGRYRGIRARYTAYDDDTSILGSGSSRPQLLLDTKFRSGFKHLQPMGLSCDMWLYEPQLPDLINFASAFSDTQIILCHVGSPLGVGRYAGRLPERFPIWRDNIRALSQFPNVAVKLGGLGLPLRGFNFAPSAGSAELAKAWAPYIETCIEAFGVHRCMFESNFPMDSGTCSYAVLWNAFKRTVSGASRDEKAALFYGTAARMYRLDL
ncbi:MAG: amidohydrolase [Rhodospirillaceae bacterium]|nr:MAG: amidohydrolase [Rhodospirillaceae bacterium]